MAWFLELAAIDAMRADSAPSPMSEEDPMGVRRSAAVAMSTALFADWPTCTWVTDARESRVWG
jgi:hypothetical protein